MTSYKNMVDTRCATRLGYVTVWSVERKTWSSVSFYHTQRLVGRSSVLWLMSWYNCQACVECPILVKPLPLLFLNVLRTLHSQPRQVRSAAVLRLLDPEGEVPRISRIVAKWSPNDSITSKETWVFNPDSIRWPAYMRSIPIMLSALCVLNVIIMLRTYAC